MQPIVVVVSLLSRPRPSPAMGEATSCSSPEVNDNPSRSGPVRAEYPVDSGRIALSSSGHSAERWHKASGRSKGKRSAWREVSVWD